MRVVRLMPVSKLRPKLRYNIREFFELYADEPLERKSVLVKEARLDLDLLRRIFNGPKEHVENIFRGFDMESAKDQTKGDELQHE